MKYLVKFLMIFLGLFIIIGETACGRISDNVPVEGSGYPHTYPRH